MSPWLRYCIGLVVALLPLSSLADRCATVPIQVGWAPWAPYQYPQTGAEQPAGLDIELISAVLAEMHCPADFEQVPWKRQLLHIKTGELDLITGASYVAEREEYGYFSKPYRQESVRLFTQSGNVPQMEGLDLTEYSDRGLQIGAVLGYFYGEDFERAMRDPDFKQHLIELPSEEVAFRMLNAGRVDAVVADPYVAAQLFEQNPQWHRFEPVSTLYRADIHFLISRASVSIDWLERFNAALLRLESAGELEKIRAQYDVKQDY